MNIENIKNILSQYREGISLEKLEKILSKKNIKDPIDKIIKQDELFILKNGIIFLKSNLIKSKNDFFKEFEDYLQGKIPNDRLRQNILNNFIRFIP